MVPTIVALMVAAGGCDKRAADAEQAADNVDAKPKTPSKSAGDKRGAAKPEGAAVEPTPDPITALPRVNDDSPTESAPSKPAPDGGDAALPSLSGAIGADDAAYFAVRDRGLVRLAQGEFTAIENSPRIVPRDVHVESDGKLYLLGADGVMRVDATVATMVAETSFKTTGPVDAFALTADGRGMWAVGFRGISRWDGDAWTTEDKSVFGASVTRLKGVVVDKDDRVWVASSNGLHVRKGEAWVAVDAGSVFERKPFLEMLRCSPDGVAFALASSQLVRLDTPSALVDVELPVRGFSSLGYLAFASDGTTALRTGIDEVTRLRPRASWKAGKDFTADHIRGVGVDERGRVWVASDIGVAILGPEEGKTEWPSGTVVELAGQVEHIVVTGKGPELPTVGPAKTGSVRGQVMADGVAVVGASVQMCPSPNMMFDTSPCDEAPLKFSSQTDAEGRFELPDVPLGAYGVAVEVAGKWQLTRAANFGAKMAEGKTLDIGIVKVKAR